MKGYAMLKIGESGWIEKEKPACGPTDAIVKPLAVATPIRIPVNEPGPFEQANKSISDMLKGILLNASSIIGISFSECVNVFFNDLLYITFLFSKIETLQILLEVSILNIFIFSLPIFNG